MKIKNTLFFSFLFLFFSNINAQNTKSNPFILYLKNGWQLHGTSIENTDSTTTITLTDGSKFVFKTNDIDSLKTAIKKSNLKKKGFSHYTEIGALAATQNRPDNVTTAAFSFQTVNGHSFNNHLFTGFGIGIDLYATETVIPLFASIRGNILNNAGFMPFYYLDGGYGWNITSSSENINYSGGLLFASGIGFKKAFNNESGFLISAGYRLQKGAITTGGIQQNFSNERISVRAGFYF